MGLSVKCTEKAYIRIFLFLLPLKKKNFFALLIVNPFSASLSMVFHTFNNTKEGMVYFIKEGQTNIFNKGMFKSES